MSTTRVLIEDPPARPAPAPDPDPDAGAAHAARQKRPHGPHARAPLVCVAGTSGAAGASTVALLLAWNAAHSGCRVLCADAAGPAGNLAELAGVASKRSLEESAALLQRGRLEADGLFATAAGGVRVIASPRGIEPAASEVGPLLALARQAHELVIVDAGTLSTAAAICAYEQASHLVWVLPATPAGKLRAQRLLHALGRHSTARELILARGCPPALGRVRPRELQRLAAERYSPLIALPHLEKLELPAGRETALEQCRTGLRELSRLTVGARAT